MNKIRLNTEFVLKWRSILINGAPANFNEITSLLFLVIDPLGEAHRFTPSIFDEGQSLSVRIKPGDLQVAGDYDVTLYVHYGEDGQTAIDKCGAFTMTPYSCDPSEISPDIETITLTGGDVSLGIRGLSAYEIAVNNGFEGTETEWLQSLQQPATDAAKQATEVLEAFTQKEADITEAEQQRKESETQRTEAETQRAEAEQQRSEAEQQRQASEQQRIESEHSRAEAETQRAEAEQQRTESEQQRQAFEQQRKESETKRSEAETLRSMGEQTRTTNEDSRTTAERSRATAEQQRTKAEQARVTAEAKRQQQTAEAIEATKSATASAVTATAEAVKATSDAKNATTGANEAAKLATEAAAKTATVDYVVCKSTATTAVKEVSITGFTLSTHCRFLVKMTYAVDTEDVSLTVRSGSTLTEAKPLTFNGAPASVNNTWRAGDILDIYYDGTSFHATHYLGGYGINEINVSEMCPKGGTNGTNKFTLAEAVKKIPEAHRRVGFKCSFLNDNNKLQTFVYQGGTWSDNANWINSHNSSLHAMYLVAGAKFHADTGFYELNGIKDLTEDDMLEIYRYTYNFGFYDVRWFAFAGSNIRTNFIARNHWSSVRMTKLNTERMFLGCKKLEVFVGSNHNIHAFEPSDVRGLFEGCIKLRDVGYIQMLYIKYASYCQGMFNNCPCLESAYLTQLAVDISFSTSPLLSYKSYKHIITEATNTAPISIKVHPTTYDYLTGVTQPTEQVGGTSEEWQALVVTATAKQITFTT